MAKPSRLRLITSGVFELLGILAIIYGFFLIAPFLGLIVGGMGALVIARAIDPPVKSPPVIENQETGVTGDVPVSRI